MENSQKKNNKYLVRLFVISLIVALLCLISFTIYAFTVKDAGDAELASFGDVFKYHLNGMTKLFTFSYGNPDNIVYFALSVMLYALIVCWLIFLIGGIFANDKTDRKFMWWGIALTLVNVGMYLLFASGSQKFWHIVNRHEPFNSSPQLIVALVLLIIFGLIFFVLSLFAYFWSIVEIYISSKIGENENVSLDEIRMLVREEFQYAQPFKVELLGQKEEPAPAPEPVPEPIPEPVPEPQIEVTEGRKKKPRVPFVIRMLKADLDIKTKYNELKNEILSYGVKSRVSRTGDVFRLHNKKYVKIYLVGKTLKVYLALNPEDYKDATFPVEDVGLSPATAEIPLLFRVRSELSVRRCKDLIKSTMEKDGLEQKEVQDTNWVNELRLQNAEKAKAK